MDPQRWLKGELNPQCQTTDDSAHDQDTEHHRTVAGVEHRIIKAAGRAGISYLDIAVKQRPLAASRAKAQKDGLGRVGRLRGLALHDRTSAPDIDAGEEEEPHHVDEMPVPGRRLEAEMTGGRE